MDTLLKALLGAVMVIVIQWLAKSKNFYIAGLVPLFPTFALISNYSVGRERTLAEFKTTLRFSMASMLPYGLYLFTLYILVDKCKLELALLGATLVWLIAAALLLIAWNFWAS